jgi:hypothetical protein
MTLKFFWIFAASRKIRGKSHLKQGRRNNGSLVRANSLRQAVGAPYPLDKFPVFAGILGRRRWTRRCALQSRVDFLESVSRPMLCLRTASGQPGMHGSEWLSRVIVRNKLNKSARDYSTKFSIL